MSDSTTNARTPLLGTDKGTETTLKSKSSRVAAFFKRPTGPNPSTTADIVRPRYVRNCLQGHEDLCTSEGLTLDLDYPDGSMTAAAFGRKFDDWKKTASSTPTDKHIQEVGEEACKLLDRSSEISRVAFQIHQRRTQDTETRWTLGQMMDQSHRACNDAIIDRARKQMGWEDTAVDWQERNEVDSEL